MTFENRNSSEVPASVNMLQDIRTPFGRELSKDIQAKFARLSPESQNDLLPQIIALLPSYDAEIDANIQISRNNAEIETQIEAKKMTALTQLLIHG